MKGTIDFIRGTVHNPFTAIFATEGIHQNGESNYERDRCSETTTKHHPSDIEDGSRSARLLDGTREELSTQVSTQELEDRSTLCAVRSERSRDLQKDDDAVAEGRPQRRGSRRIRGRRVSVLLAFFSVQRYFRLPSPPTPRMI